MSPAPQRFLLLAIAAFTVLMFVLTSDFALVPAKEPERPTSGLGSDSKLQEENLSKILDTLEQLSKSLDSLSKENTKTTARLEEVQEIIKKQEADFAQYKAEGEVKLKGVEDKLKTIGGGGGAARGANWGRGGYDPGGIIDQLPERPNPLPPPPGAVTSKPPLPEEDPDAKPDAKEENKRRREAVKEAFLHAWNAYKAHAWGYDELAPLSARGKNWPKVAGSGFGLTILDAISTLWIMDLKEEFDAAAKWIKETLSFDKEAEISVFESTIRMVAGLISAYELSGEKEEYKFFIKKACDLTDRLLWAYNTTTGIPHATINLAKHTHSNPRWTGGASVLSEFGTVQLEFRTLSYHSGNDIYDKKGTNIMHLIKKRLPPDGLPATYFNANTGKWTSHHVTLGALGDSYYEYLLKQYLLTGKQEEMYKEMWETAAKSIIDQLIKYSKPSGQMYLSEHKRGNTVHKMDHLACFAGGMFGLAAQELTEKDSEKYKEWMNIASGITETCHIMYHSTKTWLSPEIAEFRQGSDFTPGSPYYILRPETVESFFYMWRWTHDQKWRDYGWQVVRALNHWCRVDKGGFAGLKNVNMMPPVKDDLQQSFFLAETLKYLYLLFSDDDVIDLKEWVFNTEAHPFKIRKRVPTPFSFGPIPGIPDGYEEDVPLRTGYEGGRGAGRDYTKPVPPGYVLSRSRDAPEQDISTTAQSDRSLTALAAACDANPDCQGFNTNGYLKKDVSHTVREMACDLYVKQKFATNV